MAYEYGVLGHCQEPFGGTYSQVGALRNNICNQFPVNRFYKVRNFTFADLLRK